MNQHLIYFPCFAMILLSFGVLVRMFLLRVDAVRKKGLDVRYFKTYHMESERPPLMLQAERNFINLFEVPTLFYAVCIFLLVTSHVDMTMLVAAWVYVGLRYLHSFIHLTKNKIRPRMMIYGMSWLVLMFMACTLFIRIFSGTTQV